LLIDLSLESLLTWVINWQYRVSTKIGYSGSSLTTTTTTKE